MRGQLALPYLVLSCLSICPSIRPSAEMLLTGSNGIRVLKFLFFQVDITPFVLCGSFNFVVWWFRLMV